MNMATIMKTGDPVMDRKSGGEVGESETGTGRRGLVAGLVALPALAACSPTVRVEAPSEPIEINLNIRIEQEVRIKVDRELDALFDEEDDIF